MVLLPEKWKKVYDGKSSVRAVCLEPLFSFKPPLDLAEICKNEKFYQQEYCGCAFSLRDANKWRVANGREKIRIGEKFYGTEK